MKPSRTSSTSGTAIEPALSFPSLFAVSCHWSDPWLVAGGTRTGTRHSTAGQVSDDAMGIFPCGPHVLLAIADPLPLWLQSVDLESRRTESTQPL